MINNANIAFLATGDEITNGDISNTNSQHMAQQLRDQGFHLGMHLCVSDEEKEITKAINFLLQHHDILITTGGLGPTSDDRTRHALSRALKVPLIFNEEAWQNIVERLTKFNVLVHESNRQQAFFPEHSDIIHNPNGTAAGCRITQNNKLLFMLPGPPNECLPMFHHDVLPVILEKFPHPLKHKKWRLFGVSEAEIASELDKLLSPYDVITGYRWDYPYLEFKIRSQHEDLLKNVEFIIENTISQHIISSAEKTASEILKEKLIHVSNKIIICDHATEGLLQSKISSAKAKAHVIFVHEKPQNISNAIYIEISGLDELWAEKEFSGSTLISINCEFKDTKKYYSKDIPYRHKHVLSYAIEWISYKINELLEPHQL